MSSVRSEPVGKRNRTRVGAALAAATILGAAVALSLGCSDGSDGERKSVESLAVDDDTIWTCSMHPQVRQNEPGDCPLCGMDLIPVEPEPEERGTGDRVISFTETGVALMEIETAPVMRRAVAVEVELVGRVAYDAERVAVVSAWVPGRIEELHVDHVGERIVSGQPLIELYGPELVAAQMELLEASEALRSARAAGERAVREASETLAAVRERLRRWGVSADQMSRVEESGATEQNVTIVSPLSGTVVEENVTEGTYLTTGEKLFVIADLSSVWIDLAAHEKDLAVLREGDHVNFLAAALPGRAFEGVVSLVEPIVDPATRTVTVRVEADNSDGALKPDMFVTARVAGSVSTEGRDLPIVIPSTAPLLTGKRAVVYVEVEGSERPTFEGREVVLGPRAGEYYVVVSGLTPGERVVTNGAFKIDSALEIRAMPSMMNPTGADALPSGDTGGHSH